MNKYKITLNKPLDNILDAIINVKAKVFVNTYFIIGNTPLTQHFSIRFNKTILRDCLNNKNFALSKYIK